MLRAEVSLLQKALRQQQAALAKRIAEGRSEGRSRRRLLRRERLDERMRKEREERAKRRQMAKVHHYHNQGSASALGPTSAETLHPHMMRLKQTSGTAGELEDPG